jgi:hypothetical protein
VTTQAVFDAIAALPLTVPLGTLPSYSRRTRVPTRADRTPRCSCGGPGP